MKLTKQSWVLAGGFLSAVAASLCCVGPLLAIVLGLGGFAASSWFAEWRPYFLGVSFGLLALAWYLTYRRPQSESASGEACAPTTAGKGSKAFLTIVTAIAIPAAFLPSLLSLSATRTDTVATAAGVELRLRVPTMDCVACAKGIEATLSRTPGVIRATVDYDTKNAVILFGPRKTTTATLVSTVDGTSFEAELISETSVTAPTGALAKIDVCCAPQGKVAPASATADRNTMNPDRISLFTVPLVCGAAPEIGCGSRAKPLLAQLELDDSISEAWLNSAGTILAVVGRDASSREARVKAVLSVFAEKNIAVTELDAAARPSALDAFMLGANWHRGAEVDDLSRQEARIIAARLVRRIHAKIPLSAEKAKTVEARIAAVFVRRFTGEKGDPQRPVNDSGWSEELVSVARSELSGVEIVSFQEGLKLGYRPQNGER